MFSWGEENFKKAADHTPASPPFQQSQARLVALRLFAIRTPWKLYDFSACVARSRF